MTEFIIKEIVVVEGKSDIEAVKRAFKGQVDCIATHGLGLGQKLLDELSLLNEKRGIIVLTDPDYAGKRIRNIIRNHIPNSKFAYIDREAARKNDNIGVENASDQTIIEAIKRAKPNYEEKSESFSFADIVANGLTGIEASRERRIKLCKELGIEYCSAKQLLIRLNAFLITREEFFEALRRIDG